MLRFYLSARPRQRSRAFGNALLLVVLFSFTAVIRADESTWPSPASSEDTAHFGANFQRILKLLASSTPEQRHKVKVLFYGQSITAAKWWTQVADDLRVRFPHADLEIVSRQQNEITALTSQQDAKVELNVSGQLVDIRQQFGDFFQ